MIEQISIGSMQPNKKNWWLDNRIQKIIVIKKYWCKKWYKNRGENLLDYKKTLNKEAKSVVRKAKFKYGGL